MTNLRDEPDSNGEAAKVVSCSKAIRESQRLPYEDEG